MYKGKNYYPPNFTISLPRLFPSHFNPDNIRTNLLSDPNFICDKLHIPDILVSDPNNSQIYPLLINNHIFNKFSSLFFSDCLKHKLDQNDSKDDPLNPYVPCWSSDDETLNNSIKFHSLKFSNLHIHLVKEFLSKTEPKPFLISYSENYPLLGRIFTNISIIEDLLNKIHSRDNKSYLSISKFTLFDRNIVSQINNYLPKTISTSSFISERDSCFIDSYISQYDYSTYSDVLHSTCSLISGSFSKNIKTNLKTIFDFLLLKPQPNHFLEDNATNRFAFNFTTNPLSAQLDRNFYIDPSIKSKLSTLPTTYSTSHIHTFVSSCLKNIIKSNQNLKRESTSIVKSLRGGSFVNSGRKTKRTLTRR